VEFLDGTMLAQLSPPSMTFPIQRALLHPEVAKGTDAALDLSKLLSLEFRPIDAARFPLFALARQVMEAGRSAPAVYNAANEVAVAAFLGRGLPFLAISRVVDQVLEEFPHRVPASLEDVLAIDAEARRRAEIATARHA
jgi:1-deoxy-D-xylulose-5-phosphate reductoisomerase